MIEQGLGVAGKYPNLRNGVVPTVQSPEKQVVGTLRRILVVAVDTSIVCASAEKRRV